MWPFNRKKASNDMSVLQDLENDFSSIKSKVENALGEGASEYDKLSQDPEIKAVADILLSVAEADLPAGIVASAGEVFKTILQVSRNFEKPAASPAPETATETPAPAAEAPASQAPAETPAPQVDPATTTDPAATLRAQSQQ